MNGSSRLPGKKRRRARIYRLKNNKLLGQQGCIGCAWSRLYCGDDGDCSVHTALYDGKVSVSIRFCTHHGHT